MHSTRLATINEQIEDVTKIMQDNIRIAVEDNRAIEDKLAQLDKIAEENVFLVETHTKTKKSESSCCSCWGSMFSSKKKKELNEPLLTQNTHLPHPKV